MRAALLGLGVVLATATYGNSSPVDQLAEFEGRIVDTIEIIGNRITDDRVIQRELETKVGEPLESAIVSKDLARLDNLSIFAQVEVLAEPAPDGTVGLTFTVKEGPSWIPLPAINYTEENGFSYGAAVSAGNLAGKAISLSGRVYFGGSSLQTARLTWPWIAGNHLSLSVYGANLGRTDELRGFEEDSFELTPEVGCYLGSRGRLKGKLSFFQMRSDRDGITLSSDNKDQFFRVGASVGLDTRDAWRSTRKGWDNELELWHTGGDGGFWTTSLDLRKYLPTGRKSRILLSGLTTLQSGTIGKNLPVYFDYYLGGANSIRGYGVDSLGTELSGQNQMLGTIEFSHSLVPLRRFDLWKLSLRLGLDAAVFADAGVAWSESHDLSLARTRGGVGGGLRLLIPGSEMIRLDMGWSPEDGFVFHFASNGKPTAQRQRVR